RAPPEAGSSHRAAADWRPRRLHRQVGGRLGRLSTGRWTQCRDAEEEDRTRDRLNPTTDSVSNNRSLDASRTTKLTKTQSQRSCSTLPLMSHSARSIAPWPWLFSRPGG